MNSRTRWVRHGAIFSSPTATTCRFAVPALEIDALLLAQPAVISIEMLNRFEDVLLEDLNGLDPAFDRWLEDERARFQRIGRTIGESLLAKCDEPVAAIDAAEHLLTIDRIHEGAWRTIMRSHAWSVAILSPPWRPTTAAVASSPRIPTDGLRPKPRT